MQLNFKTEFAAIHLNQTYLCSYFKTGGSSSNVIDINMGAETLLSRPIDMGIQRLDAGPLDKADHKTCGEDLGHDNEFFGFRIKRRNALVTTDTKGVGVFDSRFKCFFHSLDCQILLSQFFAIEHFLGCTIKNDMAHIEDDCTVGQMQCRNGILLNDDGGNSQ